MNKIAVDQNVRNVVACWVGPRFVNISAKNEPSNGIRAA
jgi:hypothetical protein